MRRMTHAHRVLGLGLLLAVPGSAAAVLVLGAGGHPSTVVLGAAAALALAAWVSIYALLEVVLRPLQTVSNLIGALREGDFSFRARARRTDDPLDQAMGEVNLLADTLRDQRVGALEATALLRRVMEEIDVSVFLFDPQDRLRLVNRAGERLTGRPAERLLGLPAADVGLDLPLASDPGGPRVLDLAFRAGPGRYEVRQGIVRQGGVPHRLLVLADVGRTLREEERQAWQRLIRVLGHELNNSLTPIRSVAESLEGILAREPRPSDWEDDVRRGLAVIASRADALGRFMQAYGRLARLPPPRRRAVGVAALVERAARLETRRPVEVQAGPDLAVDVDPDQVEQVLINLLRNAAEATGETGGGVRLSWARAARGLVEIAVEDDGPGLPPRANLFVPFFTTKAQGSGIGLVLGRQIAEAHEGQLLLENRIDGPGCRARLLLPGSDRSGGPT